MVCTIGLMGNDTELKSLFGIVFQHRVHRGCPGVASSCLTSHSNRPMAQENMHVPIVVTWPNFSGQRYMSTNRLVVILSEGMWNSWPLRRTVPWMFRPRSHLVRTSLTFAASQNQSKPNPERFWKGFAMVCCLVCCCCCCCCLCCCFWARRGFWAEKQEICERAGSFCLPQNQSTLTVGVPIGFPPGERLVMSGVSGVPCGWRKF